MAEGRFREDLFSRLSVAPIHILPLKRRKPDIMPLAEMFRDKFCRETRYLDRRFSDGAAQAIQAYHWPGNIRELRNSVKRAVLFAVGRIINPVDLGLSRQAPENH